MDIERLEAANVAAESLLREIHTATSDMRNALRDARAFLDGYEELVSRSVAELINREVSVQVKALGEETQKAMKLSIEKVGKEFERIENIYLGKEGNDLTLDQLVRQQVAKDGSKAHRKGKR